MKDMTKASAITFKNYLLNRGYAVRTVNSMMASLNCFFRLFGRQDAILKTIPVQRDSVGFGALAFRNHGVFLIKVTFLLTMGKKV